MVQFWMHTVCVVFVYDFYILLCILSTIPWLIKTLNAIWIPEKYLISSTLSAIGKRRGKAYTWVHDTQACRFHEKEQGRMTLGKCGFQKVLWGQGPQSWERRQITKCRACEEGGWCRADCLPGKWPVKGAQRKSPKQKAKDKHVSHKWQREQGLNSLS